MRIAVGGFHIESSAFSPLRASVGDFEILEGRKLLRSYAFIAGDKASAHTWREQAAPFPTAPIDGVGWVPLVHMRSLPGGAIDAEFWERFCAVFFHKLEHAGHVDGVLLDIHGAALVDGHTDIEGEFAARVRQAVGNEVTVCATMDLHGNVSPKLFDACDLLTCYRTAPHVDATTTRHRAAKLLCEAVGGQKPHKAMAPVPLLLAGEKTSTEAQPGRDIYAEVERVAGLPGIVDASLWMGYPWGDEPRCRACVAVYANNPHLATHEAERLASLLWNRRGEFDFVAETCDYPQAVTRAFRSGRKPFFLSDTGDNTGAGGTGDQVVLLRETWARNEEFCLLRRILVATIYDPPVVASLFERVGECASFTIGSAVTDTFGPPLEVTARVIRRFSCPQGGRCVVISWDGITAIVTERRTQYGTIAMFERAGVNVADFDVVVVKMGYLEPELAKVARGHIMALTPGVVDQDLDRLVYRCPPPRG